MTRVQNGEVVVAHDTGTRGEPGGSRDIQLTATEIAPVPAAPAVLFPSAEPQDIVRHASAVARALAPVIDDRRLYTDINGRRHVRIEGWTLLGSMLGVFPVCVWSHPVDGGWEARVEARTLGGALVGAAEACCMRDEPNWRDKPDYALRSMAQTRASSKALRLPLGFVVALAGYEVTPAEELDGGTFHMAAPARNGRTANAQPRTAPAPPRPAPPAEARTPVPATEPQINAIYAIARAARGLNTDDVDALCTERYGVPPAQLSRRLASELIDALKTRSSG